MISPNGTKNLDIYGNPPLEWERVIHALDTTRDRDDTESPCAVASGEAHGATRWRV